MTAKVRAVGGIACLIMLLAAFQARAAEVQLSWEPPKVGEDGASQVQLFGYRFYYGLYRGETTDALQTMIDLGAESTYTVSDLIPGETYIFAVTSYDSAGRESPFSNTILYSVPIPGEVATPDPDADEGGQMPRPGFTVAADDGAAVDVPPDPDPTESNEEPETFFEGWKDYRLSLTIGSTNADDIGVMFRYRDSDNYYRFMWSHQHMQRSLVKRYNGVFTVLAEETLPLVPQDSYQLTIVAVNETLEVWIDGTLVFSMPDASLPDGSIALYTLGNGENVFDDIVVEDLATGTMLLCENFDAESLANWVFVDEGVMTAVAEWSGSAGALVQRTAFNIDLDGHTGPAELGTYALYLP